MFFINIMFSLASVLLSVAFFTLMERKIMGLSHFRKGPNKVISMGMSQPIADAVKLLSKEMSKYSSNKPSLMGMGPNLGLAMMLITWCWTQPNFPTLTGDMKMMVIFSTMSLAIYSMLLMSWGSNSKYAMIGGHRSVAQVVSYEVCFLLFLLSWFFISKTYNLNTMALLQQGMWGAVLCLPAFMLWFMLCLAESNRTPFDMAEGESEIVSGFNIEYGGGLFALIFITEYGMILFLGFITSLFFLGGMDAFLLSKTLSVGFLYVWARCSFPRMRYDILMMTSWKMALPFSILLLAMGVGLF